MRKGEGKSEKYQYESFKMMSDNWETIERGDSNNLAREMAELFGITFNNAQTRIAHYFYNRMKDRPIRGFEQDGKIILVYQSKINY
jgi:hypothetical protein